MPGITAIYDPNNRDINAAGDTERNARQKYQDDRWKYYDGDHWKWLKKDLGSSRDDNITLNLCGRSTDKAVEFINVPKGFDIPGEKDKPETAAEDPQDKALDDLYERHRMDIPEIILSNLVSGHTFIKLHYDDLNQPSMTLLDPKFVTVFWDAMNTKRVLFYRLQWKTGDTQYRQDIVPDWLMEARKDTPNEYQQPTKWAIIDYTQKQGSSEWRTTPNGQQIWEYPFPPVVDWAYKKRPHQYYGVSYLHNSIALNDAVNFTASNIGRILKGHAHPKLFAFGFEVPGEDAPGAIYDGLPPPGEADVKTIEMSTDLASSMNFMEKLIGEFFANQRILDQANIRDKVGVLTNFGVRMLFSDQLEMTDEARTVTGMGLGEVFRRLMVMTTNVDMPRPEPEWTDPLPTNRLELLQGATLESKLGTTSMETLAESIDRDFKTEQDKMKTESANGVDQFANLLTGLTQRGSLTQGSMMGAPQRMGAFG